MRLRWLAATAAVIALAGCGSSNSAHPGPSLGVSGAGTVAESGDELTDTQVDLIARAALRKQAEKGDMGPCEIVANIGNESAFHLIEAGFDGSPTDARRLWNRAKELDGC